VKRDIREFDTLFKQYSVERMFKGSPFWKSFLVSIVPGGHLNFPHPWPGQNPPPRAATGRAHLNSEWSC
jgi:hypothetical protein